MPGRLKTSGETCLVNLDSGEIGYGRLSGSLDGREELGACVRRVE
jgi:hypothetical protein